MQSKNDLPLISIIIPVYNRKKLVMQTIRSALNQTYLKKEVVVVDDASDDGTYEALCALKTPIVLCRQTHNKGQGAARNLGISSCRGDYVLFLDSDDVLEPDAIETLFSALYKAEKRDPIWGASYGRMLTCDSRLKEVKNKPKKYHSGSILPYLFFYNFVRTGTYRVRKSILEEMGGIKEDLCVQEDRLLLFSIAVHYKFLFVDKVIARYRRHPGIRARDQKMRILEQGTRHIDYFFQETRSLAPAISKVKNRVYAQEHLLLSKIAWRSHLPKEYLYHWRAASSYQKRFFIHPKYLIRAIVSSVNSPLLKDKKRTNLENRLVK